MKVAILLAVYNGERFLDAQLQSLATQKGIDAIDVWCSDDGSTDRSFAILEHWREAWKKGAFHILNGPRQGFSENFRSLMKHPRIDANFYAFCDQDDVWDDDRLSRAVAEISRLGSDVGATLYASRTRLLSQNGRIVGCSPLFARPPGFGNALVQNIASGNTMVFDRAAFYLLADSASRTTFPFHDWWCYLIVAGSGGRVVYDPRPSLSYRQHTGNAVGNRMSALARLGRLRHLFKGRNAAWHEMNVSALMVCRDLLDDHARHQLSTFCALRAQFSVKAWQDARRVGITRQTRGQNLTLWIAASIGKL